jgi:hypothetical protein
MEENDTTGSSLCFLPTLAKKWVLYMWLAVAQVQLLLGIAASKG